MLFVNKITSNPTVDFAAEEMKKYLRMMMPLQDVQVRYAPSATDGFRIGLMQDFGLDVSDVKNTELDDIIYIDTQDTSGIVAGDNPRSVLIAVYEFFRQNGCRWLMPGVDGEYIPLKPITPVKYRHVPTCRYRGPCIEGSTPQQVLIDAVDLIPKLGMNMFMSQFFIPTAFYDRYYDRKYNPNIDSESITNDQMLQWKAQLETELSKRGLQFHDVGHGWTSAPFGVDISSAWTAVEDPKIPEETQQYIAMIDGKRTLFKNRAINTQFCMSNPEARKLVAETIANYASIHTNVDFLHVWLADSHNNHCECAECVKKIPSDWYVTLLNDIDLALTEKNLNTRIVFIMYTETTWAPLTEKIKNPDRFTLMLAPISRSYTRSLTDRKDIKTVPFVRNNITLPRDLDTYMAYFDEWKKLWSGDNICFEYHFWRHQVYDLSGQRLARRIFEDVEAYRSRNIDGLIACGSQRSFFPNGFAYYVFARKQFDVSLTYDELFEDYYSHAYGEDYKAFAEYLCELGDALGFAYMEGEESKDTNISPFFSPKKAAELDKVASVVEKGKELIKSHYSSRDRIKTVSVRLLEVQGEYAKLLAQAMKLKALEKEEEALEYVETVVASYLGKQESAFEKYFDFDLIVRQMRILIKKKHVPTVQF
ncbi:MAG: DUF4838 domain-containing protein [Ruminococcaceae bacterium]|nr:DUF4838 domain-containing protein [Oscillospiraceae bacterium]